ncbi:MAG TPA: fumarylacetoacetate hydrolase family protein [Macromonas sp.]|nr:fumarylacetoacetate hydrolase family protein [Macromonas sp.]
MKLATHKDGSRDGQLVVVSRDLGTAHYATGIASTLRQVLDDWNFLAPQLQDLSVALNQGRARHAFPFDPRQCMAPLPRAGQWLEALAFANHVALACPQAAAGQLHWSVCPADDLQGPADDLLLPDERWSADFGAGLAAITGDIPPAATPERALEGVRLLMLANALVLRDFPGGQGAPVRWVTACSPVAVTPDELGDAWQGGRVHLTLQTHWNGRKVGLGEGTDMQWHFGQLLAQLCRVRRLRAGTVVGSGPVSSPGQNAKGLRQWPRGYASVAEKRAMEQALGGQPLTPYLAYGDSLRLEMKGRDGHSLFGAIDHTVTPLD